MKQTLEDDGAQEDRSWTIEIWFWCLGSLVLDLFFLIRRDDEWQDDSYALFELI